MKNLITFLALATLPFCGNSQSVYNGNGKTGFGNPVGLGQLTINDDGTNLTLHLIKGSGDLNDAVVIYIDSKAGGFSTTADFTDAGDDLRKAVSGFDGTNRSALTFPTAFTPDYAIAFDKGFGGVWELIGNGSHNYITSANLTPSNTNTASDYQLTFNKSAIGITGTVEFKFLVTYLSNTAYRSNEFIGTPGPENNIEWNPYTATSYLTYGAPLSLNFTDVSARTINNLVRLYWEVNGTFENETFQIERATDGQHFKIISTIPASAAGNYSYDDQNPEGGTSYYRVVLVSTSGKSVFSETVIVRMAAKETFNAFLNNGNLIVQAKGLPLGAYRVILINSAGQPVLNNELRFEGSRDTYPLSLSAAVPPGIYSIILRGLNGPSLTRQVLLK